MTTWIICEDADDFTRFGHVEGDEADAVAAANEVMCTTAFDYGTGSTFAEAAQDYNNRINDIYSEDWEEWYEELLAGDWATIGDLYVYALVMTDDCMAAGRGRTMEEAMENAEMYVEKNSELYSDSYVDISIEGVVRRATNDGKAVPTGLSGVKCFGFELPRKKCDCGGAICGTPCVDWCSTRSGAPT